MMALLTSQVALITIASWRHDKVLVVLWILAILIDISVIVGNKSIDSFFGRGLLYKIFHGKKAE
jgi:hypothetical protein